MLYPKLYLDQPMQILKDHQAPVLAVKFSPTDAIFASCGEDKPVTAARKYIHTHGILPPALLLVRRNEHTTDRYFWAEKGLFGAQYVEENHFLFPSLKPPEEREVALAVSR